MKWLYMLSTFYHCRATKTNTLFSKFLYAGFSDCHLYFTEKPNCLPTYDQHGEIFQRDTCFSNYVFMFSNPAFIQIAMMNSLLQIIRKKIKRSHAFARAQCNRLMLYVLHTNRAIPRVKCGFL